MQNSRNTGLVPNANKLWKQYILTEEKDIGAWMETC